MKESKQLCGQLMEALYRESQQRANVTMEIYTTYIPEHDRTIVWQSINVSGECIQDGIVGWYCGQPDDTATKQYSNNTMFAQYM